ncbi:proline and serine-rich protein 2-like isoform X1 [Scleropages formosus]|nr:proline and serine-rich protein 2-like isoform X1 [Scleropages formosus]
MPATPRSSGFCSQPMDLDAPSTREPRFGVSGKGRGVQGTPQHQYRPGESETLKFLSREERECIMFLEETIDSLDHDLQDPVSKRSSGNIPTVGQRSLSPKEQDIIDLVQNQPNPRRDVLYNPSPPDFQAMVLPPEAHFGMWAQHGPTENFHHDFKLPSSLNSSAPPENMSSTSHPLYHPAGLVPTPVIIAHKIAEHQKVGGGTVPSTVLPDRHHSLDHTTPDHPVKQGPPTAVKPNRYPSNINIVRARKDVNKGITAPSVQELKAQVLTHLTGQHNLEESHVRSIPSWSSSCRDPDPEKSRMEALSKLGLTADRPPSGKWSNAVVSTNQPGISVNNIGYADSSPEPVPSSIVSTSKTDTSSTDFNSYGRKTRVLSTSSSVKRNTDVDHLTNFDSRPATVSLPSDSGFTKTEISTSSYGGKSKVMTPASSIKYDPDNHHLSDSDNMPTTVSPDFTSSVLKTEVLGNSYGGKSKVMIPASSIKYDPGSHHLSNSDNMPTTVSPNSTSSILKTEVLGNSYGGKSKVMIPASSIKYDPGSHHLSNSDNMPTTVSPNSTSSILETEVLGNSYGGKSKVMIPAPSVKREVTTHYSDEHYGIPNTVAYPSNATEALSNSYGGKSKAIGSSVASTAKTETKVAASNPDTVMIPRQKSTVPNATSAGLSSKLNSRPQETPVSSDPRVTPKSSFRLQGVSVQFSGRENTDKSREQALRTLGLLN